jgi:hypothetical protein
VLDDRPEALFPQGAVISITAETERRRQEEIELAELPSAEVDVEAAASSSKDMSKQEDIAEYWDRKRRADAAGAAFVPTFRQLGRGEGQAEAGTSGAASSSTSYSYLRGAGLSETFETVVPPSSGAESSTAEPKRTFVTYLTSTVPVVTREPRENT